MFQYAGGEERLTANSLDQPPNWNEIKGFVLHYTINEKMEACF